MIVYTLEQYWGILRHYFENHSNVTEYVRKLRTNVGRREEPSAPYVRYLVKKVKLAKKPKTVATPENIAAMAESVRETESTPIHRRFQQLKYDATQNTIGAKVEAN